eukprot:SAG22_NODE_6622_length_830_cov_1.700410_2_plen_54_part_01
MTAIAACFVWLPQLFIPAGWFHEVSSYSDDTAASTEDGDGGGGGGGSMAHMAIN